jgi:hypothetical protein
MGQSEDLEEYDAELELALKREYATVFPLFRYCVITQEATYLCNKLEMDCVPNSAYLLFEIDMEDVWVWDRNRPTRIIPRAHVYTTSDVTVEQLREGADSDLLAALPENVVDQLRASLAADEEEEDALDPAPRRLELDAEADAAEVDPDAPPPPSGLDTAAEDPADDA